MFIVLRKAILCPPVATSKHSGCEAVLDLVPLKTASHIPWKAQGDHLSN